MESIERESETMESIERLHIKSIERIWSQSSDYEVHRESMTFSISL